MATATASTPTSKNSEDDFLRVLEEMNRLCGDPEEASENKEDEDDIFASTKGDIHKPCGQSINND